LPTIKLCTLSLFTWTDAEFNGEKKVFPVCPIHLRTKVRVSAFGQDVIVTCHETTNHLIRLCGRAEFEAELERARGKLGSPEGVK
jgi:hypothetical protein